MHLDIIKVYYSPMNAQVIILKTISKFTLKLILFLRQSIVHLLVN